MPSTLAANGKPPTTQISFRFKDASIDAVLQQLAKEAGYAVIKTVNVDGRVTVWKDQPITPEEFDDLSDEQLVRLVPKAYREFFPGKDFCADGHFYLHDGSVWCFFRGDLLDR